MLDSQETATALVADGKGILAADEDMATLGLRFDPFDIPLTDANQLAYREFLFTTPGIEEFLAGVILYADTIRGSARDGRSFVEILVSRGIIPGINADGGLHHLAGSNGEVVTEGLDGLRERLAEYRSLGARFTKWRAAYVVGPGLPSDNSVNVNAHALARFAALSQEAGMTPIVEPDVIMDGTHSIHEAGEATGRVLHALYAALNDQHVVPEGALLKTNMVLSGYGAPDRAGVEEVASVTLETLYRHVPAAVPGIVFLSGGQGAEEATAHLNAMNLQGPHPWKLSFSYARALQRPALQVWSGDPAKVTAAQQAFYHQVILNSAASQGTYMPEMGAEVKGASR